jgi:hypothetical protein
MTFFGNNDRFEERLTTIAATAEPLLMTREISVPYYVIFAVGFDRTTGKRFSYAGSYLEGNPDYDDAGDYTLRTALMTDYLVRAEKGAPIAQKEETIKEVSAIISCGLNRIYDPIESRHILIVADFGKSNAANPEYLYLGGHFEQDCSGSEFDRLSGGKSIVDLMKEYIAEYDEKRG